MTPIFKAQGVTVKDGLKPSDIGTNQFIDTEHRLVELRSTALAVLEGPGAASAGALVASRSGRRDDGAAVEHDAVGRRERHRLADRCRSDGEQLCGRPRLDRDGR